MERKTLLAKIDALRSLIAEGKDSSAFRNEIPAIRDGLNTLCNAIVKESEAQRSARLADFDSNINVQIRAVKCDGAHNGDVSKVLNAPVIRKHLRERIDTLALCSSYVRVITDNYSVAQHADAVSAHDAYDAYDKLLSDKDIESVLDGEFDSMNDIIESLVRYSWVDRGNRDYITLTPVEF